MSSPMWNIATPESSTARERQRHGEEREAGELQPHASAAGGARAPRPARRRASQRDDERELDHGANR